MNTLLLVDSHAIIHRAYHALPPLRSQSGIPTNAVYGFFSMLDRAIIDFKPSHVITCFDTPKPTFRKDLYEDYQANRPSMQDDLKPQFGTIKELLDCAGIVRFERPGFEADDVIGTLATKFKSKDMRVLILTGDKDILQLVDEHVIVITPQTGLSTIKLYNPEEVHKKFDIQPLQIPDYKALAGDPSDNYHAAKGIGPKTAVKLIHQFNTIENLYEHLDEVENEKVKNILLQSKEKVILFKKIATIVTDVDIECNEDEVLFKGFAKPMRDRLSELQLYSLLKRFFNEKKPVPPKKESVVTIDEKLQPRLF